MSQNEKSDTEESITNEPRRAVLAGLAGLGAAGLFASKASAQEEPSGTVGTPTNPYLVAHIERAEFVGRTDDPSDPDDGTIWYRSDL